MAIDAQFLAELKAAMLDSPTKRMRQNSAKYTTQKFPVKFTVPINDSYGYSIMNVGNRAVLLDGNVKLDPFQTIAFPNQAGIPFSNKHEFMWKEEFAAVPLPGPQFQYAYGAVVILTVEAYEKTDSDFITPLSNKDE